MNGGLLMAGVVGIVLFVSFGVYVALTSASGVRSYIGCGVQLYDRGRTDGTYDVLRCITVLYFPVWVLGSMHIRPTGGTSEYGGNYTIERYQWVCLGSGPARVAAIGRLFLL